MLQSTQNSQPGNKHDKNAKLTIMLLTISFSFLVTTTPMNVYIILTAVWNGDDFGVIASIKLFQAFAEMLMYVNHSINFYLYCATGQKFRQQLLQMVCYKSAERNGALTSTYAAPTLSTKKSRNSVYCQVDQIEMKPRNSRNQSDRHILPTNV